MSENKNADRDKNFEFKKEAFFDSIYVIKCKCAYEIIFLLH